MKAALTREGISAPEHPYTDRDVRDDPRLVDWAMAYAAQYAGSFEPMREAQHELLATHVLSPRAARIVLNCARHDYRVQDRLPVPVPVRPALPAMPPAPVLTLVPPLPELPDRAGVMRRYDTEVRVPLKVRAPFVVGRAAKLVHFTVEESPRNESVWRVRGVGRTSHGRSPGTVLLAAPPERVLASISVKTVCRFPSVLHEANLVTAEGLQEVLETPRWIDSTTPGRELLPPTLCPHCLKEGKRS